MFLWKQEDDPTILWPNPHTTGSQQWGEEQRIVGSVFCPFTFLLVFLLVLILHIHGVFSVVFITHRCLCRPVWRGRAAAGTFQGLALETWCLQETISCGMLSVCRKSCTIPPH